MPALDTTFFLDRLGRGGKRARLRAEAFASALPPQAGFLTTRFTVAELLAGVEGASDPISERQRIDDLLDGITVLDFDEAATLSYAKIYAHLRRQGRMAGTMDMLIAATTLASGEGLVTRNAKHFADIPGLVVLTY